MVTANSILQLMEEVDELNEKRYHTYHYRTARRSRHWVKAPGRAVQRLIKRKLKHANYRVRDFLNQELWHGLILR